MDEIVDIVSEMPETMDFMCGYIPTIEELHWHRIEDRLDDDSIVAFLIWIQGQLGKSDEEKELSRYITKIITKNFEEISKKA